MVEDFGRVYVAAQGTLTNDALAASLAASSRALQRMGTDEELAHLKKLVPGWFQPGTAHGSSVSGVEYRLEWEKVDLVAGAVAAELVCGPLQGGLELVV